VKPQRLILSKAANHTITLEEYQRAGGYLALEGLLEKRTTEEVKKILLEAGLRGQGGAGFPTGKKWSFLKEDAPRPRYVIANTDEMEPGTFKDRTLISSNPHALIEGTIIAGYAVSAEKGFIFIRPSYGEATAILEKALGDARKAGYVGKSILGSHHSFDLVIHRSAGRYICGEAKGLIHAVEGKRPHPNIEAHLTSRGLWGKPTIVNNAETLAYVPHIMRHGGEWFRNLARSETGAGNKIYSISGRVNRPGAFELPFGTPLREIIEEHAGGMQPGYEFKTCLPGGASTRFLPKKYYNIEMDFDSFQKIGKGHRMGTGAIMVFDDKTCLVGATLNLLQFFARESCGWCTPCREGLPYMKELLRRIEHGEGREDYIAILQRMSGHMSKAYCAFAPGAVASVEALVEDFVEEVHEHIAHKKCPFECGQASGRSEH
jgi:NADH-quinone oxidoreductase subunit F